MARQISGGRTPKGFTWDNEVYLVAENITDVRDAHRTLAHEAVGHIGVNAVVGDQWPALLSQYQKIKRLGGRRVQSILDEVQQTYGTLDPETEAREFIAVAASHRDDEGSVGRFMSKVRQAAVEGLRGMGFRMTPSMTDIDRILTESTRYLDEAPQEATAQFLYKKPFDAPAERLTDYVIRKWQDKLRPLLQTQHEIQKSTGEEIPEDLDAYRAEEAFHGKTENDLRKLREGYIEPLAEGMAKHGVTRGQLDTYVMAKHAKERNAQIAKINPGMPDGGSGMTNEQADFILEQMEADPKAAALEELAQIVYGMLAHQRTLMREGLQSDEVTDAWEDAYERYVPLKGYAANEPTSRGGRGYNVRGAESRRALGRKSEAESPVAHAIKDTTETIIRFRKNEVGNTLLALVENNPNPDYWQIFTEDNPDTTRKLVKTADGEQVMDVPVNMAARDAYFATKRNGKTYYIKMRDERLLNAMHNLGPEPMGITLQTLSKITRFLSSVNTSYNPEFMVSNFSRDIQTAVLNVMAEQDLHDGKAKGEKLAGRMVKDTPKAMRAIYASLRGGEANPEWQAAFEQFREDGAKTGWFDMKDVDGQAAELERLISRSQSGGISSAKRFGRTVGEFVEHANTAVENAVRLSAYKNAVDAGLSRKQAASLAKNLTVNFNRKGEIGQLLNTLYMFANASIQGVAVFSRTMGTLKQDASGKRSLNAAQKVASGITGASFMLAMLNRDLGR